jgi:hypothetical protein
MGQKTKLGMSLQLIQKPLLIQCNEAADIDPGCTKCYRLYPNGFYCPFGKKLVKTSRALPAKRKKLEDYLYF